MYDLTEAFEALNNIYEDAPTDENTVAEIEEDNTPSEVTESIDNSTIEEIEKFIEEAKKKFKGSEAVYDGDTHTIKITLDNKINKGTLDESEEKEVTESE